jgi:hypothetical protein
MMTQRWIVGMLVSMALGGLGTRAYATLGSGYEYRVLLDTDNNAATGCSMPVHDANISTTVTGIEQILDILVNNAIPPQVSVVNRMQCVSGSAFSFVETVDNSGWPVGIDDGVLVPSFRQADVIEAYVSRAALGNPSTMRIVITADVGVESDVLLSTNGLALGPPLIFALLNARQAPVLSSVGLGLMTLLLLGAATVLLRKAGRTHSVGLMAVGVIMVIAAVAWAATIVMDGQVTDWSGIPQLGTDLVGDSSVGDDGEDIVAAFVTSDATQVYFRIDVKNIAFCGDGAIDEDEECEVDSDCSGDDSCIGCECRS